MKDLVSVFKKVIDPAIDMATNVSLRTYGVLVDRYEDRTLPVLPVEAQRLPDDFAGLMAAAQADPLNAEVHYRLARWHQERFESEASAIEFETADLLEPLKGERRFYYALLNYHLGIIDSVFDDVPEAEVPESLLVKYPEVRQNVASS